MNNGYIKIHRKILEWEWYKEPITSRVFIHCLFKANWKDNKFQGYAVPRGSFVTSIKTLSEELSGKKKEDKVSVRNIRTALNHLKLTNDITIKTTSKFSIITINKYDEYQCDGNVSDNQMTSNRQTTDTQVTTNEERKENKNRKNNNIYIRVIDYLNSKLGTKYQSTTKATQEKINARLNEGFKLDDFIVVIDKKVKEWTGTDMEKYLRPETLFGTKFEGYLNQKTKVQNKKPEIIYTEGGFKL